MQTEVTQPDTQTPFRRSSSIFPWPHMSETALALRSSKFSTVTTSLLTRGERVRPITCPTLNLPGKQDTETPAIALRASACELHGAVDQKSLYDVAIVGAGLSGLAATVQAASVGLTTLTIEGRTIGGQARKTTQPEVDLASSPGPPGVELARTLQAQAGEFGARVAIPREVIGIACSSPMHQLELDGGLRVSSRAIVVATGARYHRLKVANYPHYEYRGIHYAATGMEAALCIGEDVVVVGSGNSAGQAAVFLSGIARHVHLLIRGDSLKERMSGYLVDRILHSQHITLHVRTEIEALEGDSGLNRVTWNKRSTGTHETHLISNVFVMIGAQPNSEWLSGHITLDAKGFVRTGFAHPGIVDSLFATSCPGVFAIGDIRSGSIKRVTSAVSEGRAVVADIRSYLGVDERPSL